MKFKLIHNSSTELHKSIVTGLGSQDNTSQSRMLLRSRNPNFFIIENRVNLFTCLSVKSSLLPSLPFQQPVSSLVTRPTLSTCHLGDRLFCGCHVLATFAHPAAAASAAAAAAVHGSPTSQNQSRSVFPKESGHILTDEHSVQLYFLFLGPKHLPLFLCFAICTDSLTHLDESNSSWD